MRIENYTLTKKFASIANFLKRVTNSLEGLIRTREYYM